MLAIDFYGIEPQFPNIFVPLRLTDDLGCNPDDGAHANYSSLGAETWIAGLFGALLRSGFRLRCEGDPAGSGEGC